MRRMFRLSNATHKDNKAPSQKSLGGALLL